MIHAEPALALETVGANPTRLWGLSMAERNARIARKAGLGGSGAPVLLANAEVAADPAWFSHVVGHPGLVLTLCGVPALAHA
ncbi:MAG: CDP-alcohol phosphatidyltransferase family protein, partial [Croceibacterium sp.]